MRRLSTVKSLPVAVLVPILASVLLSTLATSSTALATGDVNEASCPSSTESSPGFRAYLPDCRAYEQVTPASTDGRTPFLIARAPSGERVIVQSFGAFAGVEDDNLGNGSNAGATYALTRGESGWQVEALDPPASRYPSYARGIEFLSAGTDLNQTLWRLSAQPEPATEFGAEQTVYIRDGEGVFAPIAPATPAGAIDEPYFVGASASLSDDLFEVHATDEEVGRNHHPRLAYWPGDKTIGTLPSLYEYEDVGSEQSEPLLVGVSNQEALKSNRETVGGTASKQISDCGISLGGLPSEEAGESGDAYNAVSSSGEFVYFTASAGPCEYEGNPGEVEHGTGPSVNELYARVAGEHTIDISEPILPGGSAGECSVGEPCHEAPLAPGSFRGASEDGRRVFFLSEQPLVNGASAEGQKLYEERLEGQGASTYVAEVLDISNQGANARVDPELEGVARVSESGERVYFVAQAKLAGANLREGQESVQGGHNLYVYDTASGALSFVAALSGEFDERDWSAVDRRPVQTSATGQYLVFASVEHLTADDSTQGAPQLFEYDAASGTLVRVSRGQVSSEYPKGYNDDGNISGEYSAGLPFAPVLLAPVYELSASPTAGTSRLEVSEEGAVVFQSAQGLAPGALNDAKIGSRFGSPVYATNVYEYRQGNVYLISDGHDMTQAEVNGASAVSASGLDVSGNDVFFSTAESLASPPSQVLGAFYDARVDGGFPAVAVPLGCDGSACQGAGQVEPTRGTPASSVQHAGENAAVSLNKTPKHHTKSKKLARAQQLASALRRCRNKHSSKQRTLCVRQARRRYGPTQIADKRLARSIKGMSR